MISAADEPTWLSMLMSFDLVHGPEIPAAA